MGGARVDVERRCRLGLMSNAGAKVGADDAELLKVEAVEGRASSSVGSTRPKSGWKKLISQRRF